MAVEKRREGPVIRIIHPKLTGKRRVARGDRPRVEPPVYNRWMLDPVSKTPEEKHRTAIKNVVLYGRYLP